MKGWAQTQWGNTGSCSNCPFRDRSTVTNACAGNQYGAGFCRQDKAAYIVHDVYDLNMYNGELVLSWYGTTSGKCANVQGFAKYAHTWSSTGLTGFTIGIYSIGVTWRTEGHQWSSSSQPGYVATVCGRH
jgi:hypothetical protein